MAPKHAQTRTRRERPAARGPKVWAAVFGAVTAVGTVVALAVDSLGINDYLARGEPSLSLLYVSGSEIGVPLQDLNGDATLVPRLVIGPNRYVVQNLGSERVTVYGVCLDEGDAERTCGLAEGRRFVAVDELSGRWSQDERFPIEPGGSVHLAVMPVDPDLLPLDANPSPDGSYDLPDVSVGAGVRLWLGGDTFWTSVPVDDHPVLESESQVFDEIQRRCGLMTARCVEQGVPLDLPSSAPAPSA